MDELKNIEQNLTKIGKETPFKVPEGYFEGFSARLSDRIHNKNRIPVSIKYLFSWKPYLAAAVILIVALVTGNYLHSSHSNKIASERFHSEISQVVEQELYSISEETIIESMEVKIQDEHDSSSVNTEVMINYLLNEDLNDEELLNTL